MAKSTTLQVKNNTGTAIPANTLVYISGLDQTDLITTVAVASNDSESKMPAVGITREEILNGEISLIRISGLVGGFDTSRAGPNSTVFVGRNGALNFTDPSLTNGSAIIQKIGSVINSDVSPNGQIVLFPLEIQSKHAETHRPIGSDPFVHARQHETGGGDEITHGKLKSLNSDDHKLYSLADGTRPFTGTVGGVTPTADNHLATKEYVDSQSSSGTTGATVLKHRPGDSGVTTRYVAGTVVGLQLSNINVTSGIIRVLPLICPEWSSSITELAIRLNSVSGGGNARVGLYRNAGEGNLYPGTLAADSGDIAVNNTSLKTFIPSPSITVDPGELIWLAHISSATNNYVCTGSGGALSRISLGYENTVTNTLPTLGHKVSQAFGALPSTFPTSGRSAIVDSQEYPAIFVTFS